jgi:hypothetical protein
MKTRTFLKTASLLGTLLLVTGTAARGNAVFNLVPASGMLQAAIDGFTAAANRWSAVLGNNITININIGFSNLGAGTIGSTSSSAGEFSYPVTRAALQASATSADDLTSTAALQSGNIFSRLINHTSNNPNGANSATPYVDTMNRVGMTSANAKALGLLGVTTTADASISFNSSFAFDFNPDDGITAGQMDFVGAATHEIGHALGFISGVDDIDTSGGTSSGSGFSSNVPDLFRYSAASLAAGAGFTDYTADTRAKYFSVDGGTTQIALFSNGVTFGDGNQASHWKDNLGIGIMDPTASPGELLSIKSTDLRLLDVIGYTIVPEPSVPALLTLGALTAATRRRRRDESVPSSGSR